MTLHRFVIIVAMFVCTSGFAAATSHELLPQELKATADSLYAAQQYEAAANLYEKLCKEGESAEVLYNLGNAYYRMHDLGHAILNYERAAKLSPSDGDIRFNLSLARGKTIDKIESPDNFFVNGFKSVINRYTSDSWGRVAIGAFVLMCLMFLLYRFSSRMLLRKIGFFGAMVLLLFVIMGNVFAYFQKKDAMGGTTAIVMNVSEIKSSPSESGSTLFKLHEGTKVTVLDNSMREWAKIVISDGKTGWIHKDSMERI